MPSNTQPSARQQARALSRGQRPRQTREPSVRDAVRGSSGIYPFLFFPMPPPPLIQDPVSAPYAALVYNARTNHIGCTCRCHDPSPGPIAAPTPICLLPMSHRCYATGQPDIMSPNHIRTGIPVVAVHPRGTSGCKKQTAAPTQEYRCGRPNSWLHVVCSARGRALSARKACVMRQARRMLRLSRHAVAVAVAGRLRRCDSVR